MMNMALGYETTGIQQLFSEYVQSTGANPRHTKSANDELNNFWQFLAGVFPANHRLQNNLYERMMDCAVEFEESGFIAGFRYALSLTPADLSKLLGTTTNHPGEDATTPQTVTYVPKTPDPEQTTTPIKDEEPRKVNKHTNPFAVSEIDVHVPFSITTKQIGKVFRTPNSKIVYRIEERILPFLDSSYRENFKRVETRTQNNRTMVFYRLDKTACEIFLKVMREKQQYTNIAAGIVEMESLMKTVFPA